MPTAPITLDYGRPPRPLRRRLIRWALVLGTLAAVAWAGWRYGSPAYRRWQFARAQNAVAAYVAPPTQIVYDSAGPPPGAPAADYVDLRARPMRTGAARAAPEPWLRWTALWPQAPAEYYVRPNDGPLSPLFVHARRARDGTERIVVVSQPWVAIAGPTRPVEMISLQAYDFTPGAATVRPQVHPHSGINFRPAPGQRLRIYAGQPDPADPAHFTIAYDVDGTPGLLDGRLVVSPSFPAGRVELAPAPGRTPPGADVREWGR